MSPPRMTDAKLTESVRRRLSDRSIDDMATGCRIWLGAKRADGYGVIGIGSRTVRAHRAAWELARGAIPDGPGYHGVVIRHRCDVPCCINPDHMELGTQQDNLRDTAQRNRLRFGSRHHSAKLTENDIPRILAAKGKESQAAIADKLGVDKAVISNIFRGKAWVRATNGGGLSRS